MVKIPEEVLEVLELENKLCMISTVNEDGSVNLVPIGSVKVMGEDKLSYACCFDGKTTKNLKAGRNKVAIGIFKPMREGYQVKGVFIKMYDSGGLYDQYASEINPQMEKMGLDCRLQSVAVIKVTSVYALTIPIAGEKIA